jgi:hypothetical protein
MSTVYGTGTDLVDYQPVEDNVYSVTRWATFFWVPVFPLEQLVIRPGRRSNQWGGTKFGISYDYVILDRQPLSPERVVRTYLQSFVGVVAALGPMIAWLVLCRPASQPVQSQGAQLFGLAAILWVPAVIIFFQRRRARFYATGLITRPLPDRPARWTG